MERDPSREKRAAIPILVFKLGTLSPAFVSADDAALYVHEQIGTRRTVEYGSVILQRLSDQRFVASEPIADRATVFNWGKLLDRESPTKDFLHPPGYKIVGCLHSHPDSKASTQKLNPTWTAQQVETFISFFSVPDISLQHQDRAVFTVAYLSGPYGTLLKYRHSGSAAESGFVQWLNTNGPWTSPHAYDGTPEGFYKKYASVGELTFLISNAAWGGALGQVPDDWVPFVPFASSPGQTACGPLFNTDEAAWADVQRHIDRKPNSQRLAFILKSTLGNEYLASLPQFVPEQRLPADYWFPGLPSGPTLPLGFHLEGFYFNARSAAQNVPLKQPWLYRNFFRPAELSRYIAKARQYHLAPESVLGLALYMRAPDGALLRYQFSGSPAETLLMEQDQDGARDSQQAKLLAGTLSPHEYVALVAAAGLLSVVQTGKIWDKAGEVGPLWRPFSKIPEPTLSPAFITADDAARWAQEWVNQQPADKEYGGAILKKGGLYFGTMPIVGQNVMFDHRIMLATDADDNFIAPNGYTCEALYHSHPLDLEPVRQSNPGISDDHASMMISFFSPADLSFIIEHRRSVPAHYLCGPERSLLKYVVSGSAAEDLLRKRILGEEPFPTSEHREALIWMAAEAGNLQVVVPNTCWGGARGRIKRGWKVNAAVTQLKEEPPVPPLYSMIFQDAPTAANYGHDQLAVTTGNQPVVFILKAVGLDQYVAALADAVSGLRVFSGDSLGHPVLVSGFELHGMCFSSRPALGQKVEQRWLYECFVAPDELAVAIAASREAGATVKALYFNTRDGAQLEYQFSGTALESQLYGVTPTGTVTDNGTLAELLAGKLTPSEFVMRVAAAGRLSVMKTGTLWDVVGLVDERWKPMASYPQLALSAPFLTADDAARFAHEQIGTQRYGELCGLILKNADQRFVATLPQPCRADDRFAIRGIFATDHTGALILPSLHTLYGQYASCRALAMMDSVRMVRYSWSRTQALIDWQLFADVGLRHIMDNRYGLSVAYLSSAEDALIAYDVTASDAQRTLRELLEPGPQGSALDAKRAREELDPQGWVRKLAATGLRIVQGNPLWGRSAELADDWQPFAAETAYTRPDPVAFGAIFSSVTEAVLDAHSRQTRSYLTTQTDFRFVLKHGRKDAYVVSEAVPCDDKNPLLNVASLFKTYNDGGFVFPTGFTLYGLFYARQWMPESLQGAQRWLARYFLSSSDLSEAFFVAKRWHDKDLKISLPVYISTLDNALLQFQTPVATRLFDAKPHDSGSFEDVHTLLASGQLTAKEFVRKVISEAWLSVIQPSECWDETGKLGADWVPFADFSRRALSPAFLSEDDAARYAKALVKYSQDHIYGGLILRRGDGRYVATEPLLVTTENFDPKWILPDEDVRMDFLAPGMNIVARYRSRPDTLPGFPLAEKERSVYCNMFSTEVLGKALECSHLWSREYLFGPDGSVISFTCQYPDQDLLSDAQRTQQTLSLQQFKQALSPSSRTPHNPQSNEIEQQLRDGLKTPTEYVNLVLKVASMTVVEGNTMWGSARRLPAGWFYSYAFVAPEDGLYAVANRALSPVFSHIDDVARFAHHQAGARTELRYGYILKSTNNHWVASRPVKVHNLRLSPEQVFFQGQLPTGWTIQGLYLSAPARQPDELTASPIYRSFIPPSLLRAAIGALTRTTARVAEYLPLYLSCADGALLSYRATSIDADWGSELRLKSYVQKLNAAFNPVDYIRQVARAGELKVISIGEIWATPGIVGSSWLPRQASIFTPGDSERVALGPLFAHADDAARYQWRHHRHERNTPRLASVLANVANDTFLVSEALVDSGLSTGWVRGDTPAERRLFTGAIIPQRPARDVRYPQGYRIIGAQQLNKLPGNPTPQVNPYQQALADNFIARSDLSTFIDMFRNNQVTGARYYFTPRNGALLLYLPSFQSAETDMLFSGWIDPTSQKPVSTPSEVITALINSGRLYILETDTFWQPRGHVGTRLLRELSKGASV